MNSNVYLYIDACYIQDPNFEFFLPKSFINHYLQSQAWKGARDNELHQIWRDIYAYVLANIYTCDTSFEKHKNLEIKIIVAWLKECTLDFELNAKTLKRFLNNIYKVHKALLEMKKIATINWDIDSVYKDCVDSEGRVRVIDTSKTNDKVVHIDFAGKTVAKPELVPTMYGKDKIFLYMLQHIMNVGDNTFRTIAHHNDIRTFDMLLHYYEIYWMRYVGNKIGRNLNKGKQNLDILQSYAMNLPNNMLSIIEYLLFSLAMDTPKSSLLDRVVKFNKKSTMFINFLEYYRGSRLMFFKVTRESESATHIKDILSDSKHILKDISLLDAKPNMVFICYMNPQNRLFPTQLSNLEIDDMQIMAFKYALNLMTKYMLGENATTSDFIAKHDLLARQLLVSTVANKRIGIILKEIIQAEKSTMPATNRQNSSASKFIKQQLALVCNMSSFSEHENAVLYKLWDDLYASIGDSKDFSENFGIYLLAILQIFLRLNRPKDMWLENLNMVEYDKITINRYEYKIKSLLMLNSNQMRYRTELGLISFIDSLIDEE